MNLYGRDMEMMNTLRYSALVKSAATTKENFLRIAPTTEAAKYDFWRTYHQMQIWLGIDKNPRDRGWATSEQGVMLVTMCADPAPQILLSRAG